MHHTHASCVSYKCHWIHLITVYVFHIQIDGTTVGLLSDGQINELGLTALGDVMRLREFCKGSIGEATRTMTGRKSTAVSAIRPANAGKKKRSKILKDLLAESDLQPEMPTQRKKTGRPPTMIRSITLGLRVASQSTTEGFFKIKSPLGDKDVINKDVDPCAPYHDLLESCCDALFPGGKNQSIGSLSQYNTQLVNVANMCITDGIKDCTLRNYIQIKMIKGALRLHVLCTYKDRGHSAVTRASAVDMPTTTTSQQVSVVVATGSPLVTGEMPSTDDLFGDLTASGEVQFRRSMFHGAMVPHSGGSTIETTSGKPFGVIPITPTPTKQSHLHVSNYIPEFDNNDEYAVNHIDYPNSSTPSSYFSHTEHGNDAYVIPSNYNIPQVPDMIQMPTLPSVNTNTVSDIQSAPGSSWMQLDTNVNHENKEAGSVVADSQSSAFTILSELSAVINNDGCNILNVIRSEVLSCAIRSFQRKNFDPAKKLNVMFVGEDAIDGGGPRREFISILMSKIRTLPIFTPGGSLTLHYACTYKISF